MLEVKEGGDITAESAAAMVNKLSQYQQANARIHRQGQQRPVRVFRLIAKGTIDERMCSALRGKGMGQPAVMKVLAEDLIREYQK